MGKRVGGLEEERQTMSSDRWRLSDCRERMECTYGRLETITSCAKTLSPEETSLIKSEFPYTVNQSSHSDQHHKPKTDATIKGTV